MTKTKREKLYTTKDLRLFISLNIGLVRLLEDTK